MKKEVKRKTVETEGPGSSTSGFRLTGLFCERSLQVRPDPHRSSREEPLGNVGVRSYTGLMPFPSSN